MRYPSDELFPPQPGGRQAVPRVGDTGADPCGAAGRLQPTSDASLEPGAVVWLNRAQEQGKPGWWPDPDLGQGEKRLLQGPEEIEKWLQQVLREQAWGPRGDEPCGAMVSFCWPPFCSLGFLPITPRSPVLFHHTHPHRHPRRAFCFSSPSLRNGGDL